MQFSSLRTAIPCAAAPSPTELCRNRQSKEMYLHPLDSPRRTLNSSLRPPGAARIALARARIFPQGCAPRRRGAGRRARLLVIVGLCGRGLQVHGLQIFPGLALRSEAQGREAGVRRAPAPHWTLPPTHMHTPLQNKQAAPNLIPKSPWLHPLTGSRKDVTCGRTLFAFAPLTMPNASPLR